MIKRLLALALFGFFLMAPVSALAAVDFKSGEEVDLTTQAFPDDLMVAGAMLSGTPDVKGDSFFAGSYLDLKGKYGDDLNAAGSQVNINGDIADDLRAAGGNVDVNSKVGDNVFLTGGQININEYSVIGGDLYVAGGMVTIAGEIKGNLHAAGGKIVLNGIVNGDAIIDSKDFTLGQDAKVLGKLKYQSQFELTNITKENVVGGAEFKKWQEIKVPSAEVGRVAWVGQVTGWIIGILMMFVVGLIMVMIFRRMSDEVSQNFTKKMGWSILIGLILWIITPVVAIILMITVIGLPLGIIFLVLYGVVWYLAKVMAGLAVGSLLFSRKNDKVGNMLMALAVGLLVIKLISLIPFVGWLFDLVFLLTGFGAISLFLGESMGWTKKEASK